MVLNIFETSQEIKALFPPALFNNRTVLVKYVSLTYLDYDRSNKLIRFWQKCLDSFVKYKTFWAKEETHRLSFTLNELHTFFTLRPGLVPLCLSEVVENSTDFESTETIGERIGWFSRFFFGPKRKSTSSLISLSILTTLTKTFQTSFTQNVLFSNSVLSKAELCASMQSLFPCSKLSDTDLTLWIAWLVGRGVLEKTSSQLFVFPQLCCHASEKEKLIKAKQNKLWLENKRNDLFCKSEDLKRSVCALLRNKQRTLALSVLKNKRKIENVDELLCEAENKLVIGLARLDLVITNQICKYGSSTTNG